MSRLSKNILYNIGGQSAIALLGLVAVRYIFRSLGEDALGILYFTLAMNALLCALLDMGVSSTVVRELSLHLPSDPLYIRDLLRTAGLFYWGGYCVLVGMVYVLAPVLVHTWIHLKTLDPVSATQALRLLAVAALTALPRALYGSVFRGIQRMEINNGIDVVTNCVLQGGTIVVIALQGGLFQVAEWFTLCFGLSIAAYLLACAKFVPAGSLVPGYSAAAVRRNAHFAGHMLSVSLLSLIHSQADKVVVSKLMPIGVFGLYGFASSLAARVNMVTGAIAQAVFPSFVSDSRTSGQEALAAQYRKLQEFVCILTLPLFAGVCFGAIPVMTYAFGAATAKMLLLPVGWLALGYYLNSALNIPYIFSLAVGKPSIAAKANLWALFVVLPVTILLVVRFGLPGAAFSLVFYNLFTGSYLVPRVFSECLGIPALEWFTGLGGLLVLAAGTYGIAWLIVMFTANYSLLSLVIGYVCASLAFLGGAFLMAGPELRRRALLLGSRP